MSGLVDKDGKPTEKKLEDMDLDERLNVLRMGIGALIQQGNAIGAAVKKIVDALDNEDAHSEGEPEVHDPKSPEANCGLTPGAVPVPNEGSKK